ncbi:outer membrane beta-barrel protein [Halomonas daqiaonensis]|uniref:Opacity protein n=1 Tax=Halomonas daqiaonensis TaxID=650850 RepID=A0A1H7UF63_9GAMM|nr:outer membrane beta-barrel protein [Halomonas daqiaonensis]SEL95436.1 Opacity protein [Halomonas daqiaonensis]
MNMKKTIIASAIAVGTLVATSNAQAQAQGFYAYGEAAYNDIGSSKAESYLRQEDQDGREDTEAFNQTLAGAGLTADLEYNSSFSNDDSEATFGVGGGYQFNKNFSLELAYRDLGEASYQNSFEVTGTEASGTGERKVSYESDAFILRGVGLLPVTERLSLEALLGVAYVDTDYSESEVVNGEGRLNSTDTRDSESDSDFTAAYGVGASFAFNDTLTGYARWERIHDIDTEDKWGGIEADTISAGFRYHF